MGTDEVDEIVLHSLREINCKLDDDILSISQLSPDAFVDCVLRCVKIIEPDLELPKTLPRHMSQRVNVCSQISTAIKENMGYRGDLGYHHLLYPNPQDTKRLLEFLVNMLPEDEGGGADEADLSIEHAVYQAVQTSFTSLWTPAVERRRDYTAVHTLRTAPIRSCFSPARIDTPALDHFIRKFLPFITDQPPQDDVPPSVLEHNHAKLVEEKDREAERDRLIEAGINPTEYRRNKLLGISNYISESMRATVTRNQGEGGSSSTSSMTLEQVLESMESSRTHLPGTKFVHDVMFRDRSDDVVAKTETEEELQQKRESEIAELDSMLSNLGSEIERMKDGISQFLSNIRELEASIYAETARKDELHKKYLVVKKTMDLLPDAENNIKALREISLKSAQRLIALAKEWEKHRAPLVEQYRLLRDNALNQKDETVLLLQEIKDMRQQTRDKTEEIQEKDERYKKLLDYYNSLPQDIKRSIYTRRIMDIVNNVKKQKAEIDQILMDTRNLQKEINLVNDTLSRSRAVTDELIFKDAKTDPDSKAAYKHLVAMIKAFKELVKTAEDCGSVKNATLNLETKMEHLRGRTDSLNVEGLEADLKEMKTQNKKLLKQLKG